VLCALWNGVDKLALFEKNDILARPNNFSQVPFYLCFFCPIYVYIQFVLSCAFLFLDEFWTSLHFIYLVILHLKWWDGWVPYAILEESFQFTHPVFTPALFYGLCLVLGIKSPAF